VFVFGEIDCREGLLIAVDKCKYESLEEGIAVGVKAYVKAIENVSKNRQLTAYVHPIVPVLDATRSTVIAFTKHLKEAVLKSPVLRWLEFFDDLLTPEGGFKLDYYLDGTHMSPTYSPLLERALNQANREWDAKQQPQK